MTAFKVPDVFAESHNILEVTGLNAWYGEAKVLEDVSLTLRVGECLAILGRNGAGRTTLLKSIIALITKRTGRIRIGAYDVSDWKTYQIGRKGIAYCPEDRGIFPNLTCEENLLLPPKQRETEFKGVELAEIYEMFPNLWDRRGSMGGVLSGGEKQMLALARILRTGANILLLDEISEGLAPLIVESIKRTIRSLKSRGYTMMLVEQNLDFVMDLSDRVLLMEQGRILKGFTAEEMQKGREDINLLLAI